MSRDELRCQIEAGLIRRGVTTFRPKSAKKNNSSVLKFIKYFKYWISSQGWFTFLCLPAISKDKTLCWTDVYSVNSMAVPNHSRAFPLNFLILLVRGEVLLTRKVLSQEAEQNAVPSGDTRTLLMRFSWPKRTETRFPFKTSHTLIV